MTACTGTAPPEQPTTDPGTTTSSAASAEGTFIFGTGAAPAGLDPALVADAETYRVTLQVMEGLVGVDPMTSAPAPLLAKSWTELNEGRSYSFKLREDVTFHDGTAFNAAAVCANFDRWYTLPPEARKASSATPFKTVFGGFADTPEISNYEKCTASSEFTVRIDLSHRFTGFIPAMSMPGFAIASPKALKELSADKPVFKLQGSKISRYAQQPVGTGPYTFTSWKDDKVVLDAYPDYWGQQGDVQHVVFRAIRDSNARLRALQEGAIDGYDMISVSTVAELARSGKQILQRDPYSVLYLGMNQKFPGLEDKKMRQAIAHAIDKDAVRNGAFLNGTKTAATFIPPKLAIDDEGLPTYNHDPEKARRLLEEAGYKGEPLPFYYPRNVARPYLPAPEKIYAELSRQLTAVGLNIQPVPIDWSDGYLARVQESGDRAIHLLGWNGSYQDPDNFVGPLFGSYSEEFGFSDSQLFSKIDRARTLQDGDERQTAYQDINDQIANVIPAVPLVFPISALAVSEQVQSYPVSPVLHEVFNKIELR
ncbi:ABC transporter substrate-binding protein [Arthrobacter roseus]|uniref:ABC transporter substrate-binding protein n=1 Tax=Arthrobacter roseus TaxID=136274 RepID=UPI001964B220|nr:ABC transporter substrate-binding protein [Arthrobacter roseus]MBM7848949.1 peptide/nickel transport system substrate-binding protein [Arthrobacter roseus]